MIIGHSISNADGLIQAIDESVATMLQRTQKELIGMSYTSITHPADLARNMSQVKALRPNGQSQSIRKRYVGGEGRIVLLDVQVSRIGGRETGHLVGTMSTVLPSTVAPSTPSTALPTATGPSPVAIIPARQTDDHLPLRLWQRARDLLAIMHARDAALGGDLFADHAWSLLLSVYVAEAESRIAIVDALAAELGMPRPTLDRWIRVLQAKSLIDPPDGLRDALQLTQTGIDAVERLLSTRALVDVS